MFSPRAISVLVLLMLFSIVLMVAATLSRPGIVTVTPGTLAWPEAAAAINDITQIQVVGAEASATIVRRGGPNEWVVLEAGSHPARQEVVRQVLVGIAELRLEEPRTAAPSLHDRLALLDPRLVSDGGDGAGTAVALTLGTSNRDFGTLLLGRQSDRQPGQPLDALYLRFSGQDQSWLGDGDVSVPSTVLGWLPQRIMSIRDSRVWSVSMTGRLRDTLEVRRDDWQATDFTIVDQPGDRVVSQAFRVNNVATVLEDLDLTEVRPVSELDADSSLEQARIITYDGMTITATLIPDPDDPAVRWVSFSAEASAAFEPTPMTNQGTPFFRGAEEIAGEIEDLNNATDGWAYRLPRFKTDRLRVTVEEITDPAG